MKQRQKLHAPEEKFSECKNMYQCVRLDKNFDKKRGVAIMFKLFIGLSKEGREVVVASYEGLADMADCSSRTAITQVKILEELGYISKEYIGGSHSHDCNQYQVHIPRIYYQWLKPSKRASKFSPQQQIKMARATLIKHGAVGQNELNHAILQTKLKPEYEVLETSTGLKRIKAKATISNTLKKFNEKNNVEFPTAF